MNSFIKVCHHILRAKTLLFIGLYFISIISHESIFLFTTCYNWNEGTHSCKDTNLKIGLLILLFAQDIFFSFKRPIVVLSPLFYVVSFLFFLAIFTIDCNVYIDIITLTYNLFLFITSYFVYDDYERIHEQKENDESSREDSNDDYPNVEIRTFVQKKPQTLYYQSFA